MKQTLLPNVPKQRLSALLLGTSFLITIMLWFGGQAPSWAAPGQNSSNQTIPPRPTTTPTPQFPNPIPTAERPGSGDNQDDEDDSEVTPVRPDRKPPIGPARVLPGSRRPWTLQPVEPEDNPNRRTSVSELESNSSLPSSQSLPEESEDGGEGNLLQADLYLSLKASHTTLQPGETLTLTLILGNNGPISATQVKVRETLPPQLDLLSAVASRGDYDFGREIWQVDALPPDQQLTFNLVARATAAGLITNTAEIIAVDQPDPDSTAGNGLPYEDDQASLSVLISPETASASREETTTGSTAGRIPPTWGEASAGANLLWLYALIFGVILLISGLVLVHRS